MRLGVAGRPVKLGGGPAAGCIRSVRNVDTPGFRPRLLLVVSLGEVGRDGCPLGSAVLDEGFEMWLFGFQRGVMVASRSQLGRPA
jgi:hypothetical protein